jgi:predicted TIM-barrel fold metal-dependent hydrolase
MSNQETITRRRLLTMVGAAAASGPALASIDWSKDRIQPSHYATGWSPKPHPMAESTFVFDGVAHCYNHAAWNRRIPRPAYTTTNNSYKYHHDSTPDAYRLTYEEYSRDWQAEETADVMFLESHTDMMVMHSVPMYDAYWDGLVSNEKGAYLKGKYPERVLWYGAVDMFDSFENITRKVDQLMAQGCDGIKLYPMRTNILTKQQEGWFMDDEKLAFPLFEYCLGKGMKHIGVHKLSGWVDGKTPALGINDIHKAAAAFRDITFHVVHAGEYLFEQQVELMRKHENVTAVMEGPMLFGLYDKEFFDSMMSIFMRKLDVERMIYASTSPNQHPYWIVNHFFDYKPPKGANWRLTDEQKEKILGLNLARYHGIDAKARKAALQNDKFGKYIREHGLRQPYIEQRRARASAFA